MYGYIYKTTNRVNGKIYVGQKKSNNFLAEQYLGSGVRLSSAIKHYGSENFTVELIDTAETKYELDDKERYWISELKSQFPDIGYNIADGGDGGDTFTYHSVEEQQKIIEKIKKSLYESDKKGRVCITKDSINRYVTLDNLQEFLNDGWSIGRIDSFPHKTGYRQSSEWVQKRIATVMNRTPEQKEITSKLHSEATKLQMAHLTPEQRSILGKKACDARRSRYPGEKQMWVNKDGVNKFIFEPEYDDYVSQGYTKGMSVSNESRRKRSESGKKAEHRSGHVYVYKGDTCISINSSELDTYISDGWTKGNLFLRGIKKCKKE